MRHLIVLTFYNKHHRAMSVFIISFKIIVVPRFTKKLRQAKSRWIFYCPCLVYCRNSSEWLLEIPYSLLIGSFTSFTRIRTTNPYVIVPCLDFSKTFDTVRHCTLLENLVQPDTTWHVRECIQLDGWLLQWPLTLHSILHRHMKSQLNSYKVPA